jgi:hypothetical protein
MHEAREAYDEHEGYFFCEFFAAFVVSVFAMVFL